jgi:hypothetical protein
MISQKQLAANRRNALKSTGPKTPEGKAVVRLNALRHGLRSRSLLLPGENIEELRQLCADLEADWQPRNRTEQLLVEQMALAHWKLARLEVGERSILRQDIEAERQLALLDRFSVQRVRLERCFNKTMRELEHLRETLPAPPEDRAAKTPQPLAAVPEFRYLMSGSAAGYCLPLISASPALIPAGPSGWPDSSSALNPPYLALNDRFCDAPFAPPGTSRSHAVASRYEA